jgi:hypothetical protein
MELAHQAERHQNQIAHLTGLHQQEITTLAQKHQSEIAGAPYRLPFNSHTELPVQQVVSSLSTHVNDSLRLLGRKILTKLVVGLCEKERLVQITLTPPIWDGLRDLLLIHGWTEAQKHGLMELRCLNTISFKKIFNERRLGGDFVTRQTQEGEAWVWVSEKMPPRFRCSNGTLRFYFYFQSEQNGHTLSDLE